MLHFTITNEIETCRERNKSNRWNKKLNLMDLYFSHDETKENTQLICRITTNEKEHENAEFYECRE